MSYDYLVISTGEVVTVEQRITEEAYTTLEINGEFVSVRRLISNAPAFNLKSGASGGWSETGYSVPENKRKLDYQLGKK